MGNSATLLLLYVVFSLRSFVCIIIVFNSAFSDHQISHHLFTPPLGDLQLMGPEQSCLWWSYRVTRDHILKGSLGGHQEFRGVCWHPTSIYSFRVCTCPRPISMGSAILYSCSGVHKSRYLAVRSGSIPDTPEPLSRACTGPIVNMVHQNFISFQITCLISYK